jgi:hypothetical protein
MVMEGEWNVVVSRDAEAGDGRAGSSVGKEDIDAVSHSAFTFGGWVRQGMESTLRTLVGEPQSHLLALRSSSLFRVLQVAKMVGGASSKRRR